MTLPLLKLLTLSTLTVSTALASGINTEKVTVWLTPETLPEGELVRWGDTLPPCRLALGGSNSTNRPSTIRSTDFFNQMAIEMEEHDLLTIKSNGEHLLGDSFDGEWSGFAMAFAIRTPDEMPTNWGTLFTSGLYNTNGFRCAVLTDDKLMFSNVQSGGSGQSALHLKTINGLLRQRNYVILVNYDASSLKGTLWTTDYGTSDDGILKSDPAVVEDANASIALTADDILSSIPGNTHLRLAGLRGDIILFDQMLSQAEMESTFEYLTNRYVTYNDNDNDAIPDWWENIYGLDTNNTNDALEDFDEDGLSNLEEFTSNPPSSPLDPLPNIPSNGLVVWLSPDDLPNGEFGHCWIDRAGRVGHDGYHNSTGGSTHPFVAPEAFNGQNALVYDTDDWINIMTHSEDILTPHDNGFTIAFAIKTPAIMPETSWNTILTNDTYQANGFRCVLLNTQTSPMKLMFSSSLSGGALDLRSIESLRANTPYVVIVNYRHNGISTLSINGMEETTSETGDVVIGNSLDFKGYTTGNITQLAGMRGDILIYNRSLNANEEADLRNHLESKYLLDFTGIP